MAVLSKGTTFATGNQVTAANLNAHVDSATFAAGAVDDSTTQLSGGAIIVKDAGITAAKLATASNGELFIGNGTGFTKTTLTAGTNVAVTNASGAITVGITGQVAVANGGTGASTAAAARSALEIGTPVAQSADVSNATTTYADITGLSVNITSGVTYYLESTLVSALTSGSDSATFKLTGTGTVSAMDGWKIESAGAFTTGETGTSLPYEEVYSSAATKSVFMSGIRLVCNGSGTLKWQLKATLGTGTIIAYKGSFMRLSAI